LPRPVPAYRPLRAGRCTCGLGGGCKQQTVTQGSGRRPLPSYFAKRPKIHRKIKKNLEYRAFGS
jgi:hypothetical protein